MEQREPEVTFYAPGYNPEGGLTYVIIGARYLNRWIFVFHNSRQNYGLPAGHIVPGEDPMEAARRELVEETGAMSFTITTVATYSVDTGERKGSGRLYFAEIEKKGDIIDTDEIGHMILSESIPGDVAFPAIQVALFRRLEEYFPGQKSG